jgi:hypothetical protein
MAHQASDFVISCRGLVLKDDLPVLAVKNDIWPAQNPVRSCGQA